MSEDKKTDEEKDGQPKTDNNWEVSTDLLNYLNPQGMPPPHPYIVAIVGLDQINNNKELQDSIQASIKDHLTTLANKWKESGGSDFLLLIPDLQNSTNILKGNHNTDVSGFSIDVSGFSIDVPGIKTNYVRVMINPVINNGTNIAAGNTNGFNGIIAIRTPRALRYLDLCKKKGRTPSEKERIWREEQIQREEKQIPIEDNITLAEYLAYRCHTLFVIGNDVEIESTVTDITKEAVCYKLTGKLSKTHFTSFDKTPLVALPEGPVVQIYLDNTVRIWTKDNRPIKDPPSAIDTPPIKDTPSAKDNRPIKNNSLAIDNSLIKVNRPIQDNSSAKDNRPIQDNSSAIEDRPIKNNSSTKVSRSTTDDCPIIDNRPTIDNRLIKDNSSTTKRLEEFYNKEIFETVLNPLGAAVQDDAQYNPDEDEWLALIEAAKSDEIPQITLRIDNKDIAVADVIKEDVFFKSFVKTNYLANHFEHKKNYWLCCIFFLTFLSALTFSASSIIQTLPSQLADAMPITGCLLAHKWLIHLFNITAFLGLGLFIFIVWQVWGRPVFLRYHQYRALAEIMKVQLYWRAAGIHATVTEFFRPHQVLDDSWFRCWCNGTSITLDHLNDNYRPIHYYKQMRDIKDVFEYWKDRITTSKYVVSRLWDNVLNSLLVVAGWIILGCIVGIVFFNNYISDRHQIFTLINMSAWGLICLCIVLKICIRGLKNTGTGLWLGIFLFVSTFLILVSNALTYKLGNSGNSLLQLVDINNILLCFFASLCVAWKVFVGLNQSKKDEQRDQTLREFFELPSIEHGKNHISTIVSQSDLLDLGTEVIYANCTWLLSAYDVDLTPNDSH